MIRYVNDNNGNLVVVVQQTAQPINTSTVAQDTEATKPLDKTLDEQRFDNESPSMKYDERMTVGQAVAKALKEEGHDPELQTKTVQEIPLEDGNVLKVTTVPGTSKKDRGINLNKNC